MPRCLQAVTAIALCCTASAFADVVELPAARDNTLYQNPNGWLSNGVGEHFFAGTSAQDDNNRRRRGVIAFDIAAVIPAGATINSVELTLYMSRTSTSTSRTIGLHALLTDWGEGDSNAPGQEGAGVFGGDGDATWLYTFFDRDVPEDSPQWDTPGGDFEPTPSATQDVGDIAFYSWTSTPAMVADVQAWLDAPDTDFGWAMVGPEDQSETVKRFNTHEYLGTATRKPKLVIDFTMNTPPCPSDIDGNGAVDVNDLLAVLGAWGDKGGDADVNDDGVVDVADLLQVLADWGPCPRA